MLSKVQFAAMFPKVPVRLQDRYHDALERAMEEFGIVTPARAAAFLAQIGHETMGLQFLEELGGDTYFSHLYENREDLGNEQPGDGALYHGRGMIQLTGRANYRDVGKALGLSLEQYPALAADPDTAARIAGYFWKHHGLNELADKGDFSQITRAINGGLNGEDRRLALWERAKAMLPETGEA